MTLTPASSGNEPGIVGTILGMGLDYVAWTQVIPAVFAWLLALFFLLALLLVDMDVRGENPAENMQALGERFPVLEEKVGPWIQQRVSPSVEAATDPETGAVDLGKIDFYGFATRIWLSLSLAGMVLGLLLRLLRGPRPGRTLRRKLLWTFGACGLLVLAYQSVFVFGAVPFEGSFLKWLLLFASLALLVFLVTAWSISVSHGLNRISRQLAGNVDASPTAP